MKPILIVLAWTSGTFLALLAVALYFMGGLVQAVFVALAALFVLPPLWDVLKSRGYDLVGSARIFLVGVILLGTIGISAVNPATSIYKSPEIRQKMEALYRDKLDKWPVPVEQIFVDTSYGRIHVLASGPKDAPPVLLIHASALAAWSWLPNVAALAEDHRVYAPDNLGEIGLNEHKDINRIPSDAAEIAGFVREISDGLGIERSHVVGASIGGYIATTYALEMPERVDKLALLGPMGFGHTSRTVALMVLAQAYPLPALQNWTLAWALGESKPVSEEFGDWFRLVLNGTVPRPIPPASFTPARLQDLNVPTLTIFGTKDAVIGSSSDAVALARNIPEVKMLTVQSGHLIGAELPGRTNDALVDFLID